MSLKLILGRSGTGKTTYCINDILNKQKKELEKRSSKNLILIVPEQYSLQGEKSLLSFSDEKSMINSQILTFKRLAFNVLTSTYFKKNKILEDIGKILLLKKICIDKQDEFKYFKLASEKKGFIALLSDMISEFYKYDIRPDQIKNLYSSLPENKILGQKLYDAELVFDTYLSFLKNNFVSNEETLDILSKNIEKSEFIKNSEIWIDGFNSFTEQEFKVISELMKYSENVTITITTDPKIYYLENINEINPFYEPYLTIGKLKEKANLSNVKILNPIELYNTKRYKNQTLKLLEEKFFTYAKKTEDNKDAIKIFEAKNKYLEVENTAIQIIDSIKNYNYKYKDIAIVVKNISDYKNIISFVFKDYEIPIFIDSKKDLSAYPLASYIKNLLGIVAFNFSYESVFGILKTGLCDFSMEETDILENYVLANGIKSFKWEYEFKEKNNEELSEKLNDIRLKFLEFIKPFSEKFNNTSKYEVSEISYSIYNFLTENKINEKISDTISSLYDRNDFEKVKIHKQCFELIISILSKINEILGNEKITIGEFLDILEVSFEESEIYLLPTGIDKVIVGDMERSRLPEIKQLFILGVNEGIIPSTQKDEGIFISDEREELEKRGLQISFGQKRRSFYENFLIYQAFTKPSEKLYLSYPIGDFSGNSMSPSYLIGKIQKMFNNFDVISYNEKSDFALMKMPTFHKLASNLSKISDEDNNFWKDVYSCFYEDEKYKEKLNFLENNLWEENSKFILSEKTLKKLFNKNINSSISKLEKYSSCPFSYYMKYILKAKERKIYSVEPVDMGMFFHGILEDFSNKLSDSGIEWGELSEAETEKTLSETIEKNVSEIGGGVLLSSSTNKAILEKSKTTIKKVIDILTYQIISGGFKPKYFEMEFGLNSNIPPIEIPLDNNTKLILSGKIDRVDVLNEDEKTYIKIIDYKSGSKEFSLTDIFYGLQLQLMIYISALTDDDSTFGENTEAAGAYYFKIKNPIIKSKSHYTEEEIEKEVKESFKMSGITLDDNVVLKNTDKELFDENDEIKASYSSDIVPVSTGTKKQFKAGSVCVSKNNFSLIMEYAEKKAQILGENIAKGIFTPKPIKTQSHFSCAYCEYKSVCRFNMAGSNKKAEKLSNIKNDDIYTMMKNIIENKEVEK